MVRTVGEERGCNSYNGQRDAGEQRVTTHRSLSLQGGSSGSPKTQRNSFGKPVKLGTYQTALEYTQEALSLVSGLELYFTRPSVINTAFSTLSIFS